MIAGLALRIVGPRLLGKLKAVPWLELFAAAVIALLIFAVVTAKLDAWHWQKVADNRLLLLEQERAAVRAKTAEAQATDAQNVITTERKQLGVSTEVSNEYQARIAALRARADGLQRQLAEARRAASGSGAAPVSGLPDAAGRPDAAAADYGLPRETETELALQADLNTTQLLALQQWVREQQLLAVSQ